MTALPLEHFHSQLGSSFLEINGFQVVDHYGSVDGEHRALTGSCAFLDLSFRGRLVLLGADRHKLLNGQVTNNIKDLQPGTGCYAALVNAKAKMLADMHVHALADELLLDLEPGLAAPTAERLEKFIVADDVQVVDAAPHYGLLSLQGPRARRAAEALGLFPSVPEAAYRSVTANPPGLGTLYLMNLPRAGSQGFDVYVPVAALGAVAESMLTVARETGGGPAGWAALEVARVESGTPRFGVDMDETTLPPEAGLGERGISYTKGCYSGQEVIARIRTYGQVAKALRGLLILDGIEGLPPHRTKLFKDGKEVGWVTSATRSPRRGGIIALGYVRKECNGPGETLKVGSPDGEATAVIVPLPFAGGELAGV
ncbi:MAG: folate-binding protein YgfZ [Limisphaerales bacterium]